MSGTMLGFYTLFFTELSPKLGEVSIIFILNELKAVRG